MPIKNLTNYNSTKLYYKFSLKIEFGVQLNYHKIDFLLNLKYILELVVLV